MPPAHVPPRIAASFAGSVRLLRARSAAIIALGAGIVLALLSVCCGMGVIMAPWLLCELQALTLAQAIGQVVPRGRTWILASGVLLFAVMLTASVGWLSFLGLGTDAARVGAPALGLAARLASPGALFAVASGLTVLVFVLPFLYAPLILIEARAGLSGAVLESARLVARGGVLAHAALSLCANLVQVAPVLLAGLCAVLLAQDDQFPLWSLFSLPLLSLSVPLGQGMLISAYAERRAELEGAPRKGAARSGSIRALLVLWALLVAAPLLSFGMLGASLVRPSRIAAATAPGAGEPVAELRVKEHEQLVHPEGTALTIAVDRRRVRVEASDGGGVGELPLRSALPIEELRVLRVRDRYALELQQGGRAYLTVIDRAGVRQDDDLRARLLDRLPSWALLAMLASLLLTACVLLPVLSAFAELRRLQATPGALSADELARVRRRTSRRAFAAAFALAPLAALSLHFGARSLL